MPLTYLLLGANIGDVPAHLAAAVAAIEQHIGPIKAMSSIYRTAAWGNTQQNDFFNQVLIAETLLAPLELLAAIHDIEKQIGRVRREKWGPRIIDIDILIYDEITMQTPKLTIPHPHLPNRRFALVPLCEIAPECIHHPSGLPMAQLLEQCPDTLAVVRV